MQPVHRTLFFLATVAFNLSTHAQEDTSWCHVRMKNLMGSYSGECKLGFAEGKGEAVGYQRYVGNFKDGMPNGNGTYYYSDSMFHVGSFQDGLKEGKGESHYLRKGLPDSVVKGYWSADEFRGKKYVTYNFSTTGLFDRIEITPSDHSGNTITFEMTTTSGTPNGAGGGGLVLNLVSLVSPNGCILKMRSKMETDFKTIVTYELVSFPCKLFGTLTTNETFDLELYKAADWKIRFYKNQ